jgi:hypothetical protein
MSATTAPTQAVLWCKGTHQGNRTPTWRHGSVGRSTRVRGLSVETSADRPRTPGAADRGHRQLHHNSVGALGDAAPLAGSPRALALDLETIE